MISFWNFATGVSPFAGLKARRAGLLFTTSLCIVFLSTLVPAYRRVRSSLTRFARRRLDFLSFFCGDFLCQNKRGSGLRCRSFYLRERWRNLQLAHKGYKTFHCNVELQWRKSNAGRRTGKGGLRGREHTALRASLVPAGEAGHNAGGQSGLLLFLSFSLSLLFLFFSRSRNGHTNPCRTHHSSPLLTRSRVCLKRGRGKEKGVEGEARIENRKKDTRPFFDLGWGFFFCVM